MNKEKQTPEQIIDNEIALKKLRILRSEFPEQSLILDSSNFHLERQLEHYFKISIEVMFPQNPLLNVELLQEMTYALQHELIPKILMIIDYMEKTGKKFEYSKDLEKMFGKTITQG